MTSYTLKKDTAGTPQNGFYGWFALAGAVLVTLVVGGAFVNAFGVFLPVLSDQFGWSRGDVAIARWVSRLSAYPVSFSAWR